MAWWFVHSARTVQHGGVVDISVLFGQEGLEEDGGGWIFHRLVGAWQLWFSSHALPPRHSGLFPFPGRHFVVWHVCVTADIHSASVSLPP